MAISVPACKLSINQSNSVVRDSVELEIKNICNARCNGSGFSLGAGISYDLKEVLTVNLGYWLIINKYSGSLMGSTPVLGFEVLPIAHQLQFEGEDNMQNHLITFGLKHKASGLWSYALNIDYMNSNNKIFSSYKLLSLFGIGSSRESIRKLINLGLYKVELKSEFTVTQNFGVALSFRQYIPVMPKSDSQVKTATTNSGQGHSNKNVWGGSLYCLTLNYKFN